MDAISDDWRDELDAEEHDVDELSGVLNGVVASDVDELGGVMLVWLEVGWVVWTMEAVGHLMMLKL